MPTETEYEAYDESLDKGEKPANSELLKAMMEEREEEKEEEKKKEKNDEDGIIIEETRPRVRE